MGFSLLAIVQLVLLALSTPMYEIDTNSFVRGGFSWDIFHNPFLNLYIAVVGKFLPNLWVLVIGQILFYAVAASFLIQTLFQQRNWQFGLALGIAALEPLTMFYNFSLLAESFFTSFALLSVAFLIRWCRSRKQLDVVLFGLMMGLTFMTKLSAMIHLPLFGLILLRFGWPLWPPR